MTRKALVGVLIIIAAHAIRPAAPAAQPDDPLRRITSDIVLIRAQIELALRYDRAALEMLRQSGGSRDAIANARLTAKEAYVMARFAWSGLGLKVAQGEMRLRFKDPILDLARAKVVEAWDYTRGVIETGQLETQMAHGQRAIELLEEALLLI